MLVDRDGKIINSKFCYNTIFFLGLITKPFLESYYLTVGLICIEVMK